MTNECRECGRIYNTSHTVPVCSCGSDSTMKPYTAPVGVVKVGRRMNFMRRDVRIPGRGKELQLSRYSGGLTPSGAKFCLVVDGRVIALDRTIGCGFYQEYIIDGIRCWHYASDANDFLRFEGEVPDGWGLELVYKYHPGQPQ